VNAQILLQMYYCVEIRVRSGEDNPLMNSYIKYSSVWENLLLNDLGLLLNIRWNEYRLGLCVCSSVRREIAWDYYYYYYDCSVQAEWIDTFGCNIYNLTRMPFSKLIASNNLKLVSSSRG